MANKFELKDIVSKASRHAFGNSKNEMDMEMLAYAAGARKFSSLCGFTFVSKTNKKNPIFKIIFVSKVRSKIYHAKTVNPAAWYIEKVIDRNTVEIIDAIQLYSQYDFDLKEFFESDIFKNSLDIMLGQIKNGMDDAVKFAKSLENNRDQTEASKYISALRESFKLIKDLHVYDKRHNLVNLDNIKSDKYAHDARTDLKY